MGGAPFPLAKTVQICSQSRSKSPVLCVCKFNKPGGPADSFTWFISFAGCLAGLHVHFRVSSLSSCATRTKENPSNIRVFIFFFFLRVLFWWKQSCYNSSPWGFLKEQSRFAALPSLLPGIIAYSKVATGISASLLANISSLPPRSVPLLDLLS